METRRKCRAGQPRAGTDPTAAFVVHEKCLLLGNETLSVAKTAERRELSLQAAAGPHRASGCTPRPGHTRLPRAGAAGGARRLRVTVTPGGALQAPCGPRPTPAGGARCAGEEDAGRSPGARPGPSSPAGVPSRAGSALPNSRRRAAGSASRPDRPSARPPSTSRLPPPTVRLAHVAVPLPPAVTGPACPPPCSPAPTGQRAVTRPAPGPPPRRLPPPLAQISGTASLETY